MTFSPMAALDQLKSVCKDDFMRPMSQILLLAIKINCFFVIFIGKGKR